MQATVKRWTGVLKVLERAVGTGNLGRVRRSDLISWKASLLASGSAPRTVRDAYIAAVKAVSNWAVANGHLDVSLDCTVAFHR
ncbi:hypothetical protein ACFZ8E_04030 [Methylobacterium sp. HMF5984]|uniref:hypothetical protein n=1 Tax=Methylobacterium sp. HMF5984 TaxID=3367370 RepID=UPI0038526600